MKRLLPLAALSLLPLAAGCNQDSIFDYIAEETAPTTALIKGAPSRIVEAAGKLYIANGRIWEYDLSNNAARWSRSTGPGGYVVDVASTTDGILYALAIENTATQVWMRKNNETNWTDLASPGTYGFIQNIFGAGDTLVATGSRKSGSGQDYAILYYDQSASELKVSKEIGGALLSGAGKVGSTYYLATTGQGLYSGSDFSNTIATPSIPVNIGGLLQAKGKDQNDSPKDIIIGICAGGVLLYIDDSGPTVDPTSLGGTYTGALALMEIPDKPDGYDKLLLLGYIGSNSSYEHGYVELRFKSDDGTHEGSRRIPGQNQPSSISASKYQQYDSSLRRYPVTALWVLDPVVANEPAVIFAATSNQGLYSYRNRSNGGWQWNHEE
jgi:hypothetical protein